MKKTFPIICILVFLAGIILIVTSDTGIVSNYAGSIIYIFVGIYLAIYFHAYFRKDKYCTLLIKEGFSPKAVSKMMGHAKEIITLDLYSDNTQLIADGVAELQPFIEEVLPNEGQDSVLVTESMDVVINAKSYLS